MVLNRSVAMRRILEASQILTVQQFEFKCLETGETEIGLYILAFIWIYNSRNNHQTDNKNANFSWTTESTNLQMDYKVQRSMWNMPIWWIKTISRVKGLRTGECKRSHSKFSNNRNDFRWIIEKRVSQTSLPKTSKGAVEHLSTKFKQSTNIKTRSNIQSKRYLIAKKMTKKEI